MNDPFLLTAYEEKLAEPTDGVGDCVICTVASEGYENWLWSLLRSIVVNADVVCDIVVLILDESSSCIKVCEEYGVTWLQCKSLQPKGTYSKALMYSVARALPYKKFLCIDVDLLILGSLATLFNRIPENAPYVSMARDAILFNKHNRKPTGFMLLRDCWKIGYLGDIHDMGLDGAIGDWPFMCNDGVLAGNREGLLLLEQECIKLYKEFPTDFTKKPTWRQQGYYNIALARLIFSQKIRFQEMHEKYNCQLMAPYLGLKERNGHVFFHDGEVIIPHFAGVRGKKMFPGIRALYEK